MNEALSNPALAVFAGKVFETAGERPKDPLGACATCYLPIVIFVNKPQRKPKVTTGNPCVLHSTVAGVEIRITNGNRFFCVYKDKTAFPYIAGSSELKFDDSQFTVPQAAADKIHVLLMKQVKLRMSRAYQQDLEDERNEDLWKFTDEY